MFRNESETGGTASSHPSESAGLAPATLPSAADVKAWEGYQLDEITGQGVAKVEGLFIDRESGEPAWVLVKLGRFGKTVPVSVRECAAAAGRVWVPHDREVIRDAPAVDPTLPLNREQEKLVLDHYGIPETVGRGAEIAGRPEGATTAVPPA
ncbi:MAG: hypothetical protein WEB05_06235 [Solirubrobacterales bacterium]